VALAFIIHSHPFSADSLFTAPPPPHTYTLSLHDALPISTDGHRDCAFDLVPEMKRVHHRTTLEGFDHTDDPHALVCLVFLIGRRSEEHTSELQSPYDLVCRLLLEKKKIQTKQILYASNIL